MSVGELHNNIASKHLINVLADYGINGVLSDINVGPLITTYEFIPKRGTRCAKLINVADDIARDLAVRSLRIAPMQGTNAIGIEVPNTVREVVSFAELLRSPEWTNSNAILPLALGKDVNGRAVIVDLSKMPHVLIAGTTGSGKSVGIHNFIMSLLSKFSPHDCKFIMIDPKQLELTVYNPIPHLLSPVITKPSTAVTALNWVVWEMERRYSELSKVGVRNIEAYNSLMRDKLALDEKLIHTTCVGFGANDEPLYAEEELIVQPLPYIVIIIDEVADLMVTAGKEVERIILRLAGMARAAGIHLVLATQRPSTDIITGTIKANFPTRISFKVGSRIDSRTIIGEAGAESLLGNGDMLMLNGSTLSRVHGAFVSTQKVEEVVEAVQIYGKPVHIDAITAGI